MPGMKTMLHREVLLLPNMRLKKRFVDAVNKDAVNNASEIRKN